MQNGLQIPFRRINHITLPVPAGEEEQARGFYGGVLGLEEIPRARGLEEHYNLIWYALLDIQLHLDFSPPWAAPALNHHVAVEVTGIEKIRRELESKHATIREAVPLADRTRFYVLDPFGNYFELIEFK